jgi:hypothetical protein
MKEEMLIKNLSQGMKPFRPAEKISGYFLKWIGFTLFFLILSWWVLPLRPDWFMKFDQPVFHVENILWLGLTMLSSSALYYSTFPQEQKKNLNFFAYFSIALLVGLVLWRTDFSNLAEDFHGELSLWKGRCGIIITIVGLMHATMMGIWASHASPRSGAVTGLWCALSASSLGCLLMQFVCFHNHSLHLILWHFLPLTGLCFLGQFLGRRWLKW